MREGSGEKGDLVSAGVLPCTWPLSQHLSRPLPLLECWSVLCVLSGAGCFRKWCFLPRNCQHFFFWVRFSRSCFSVLSYRSVLFRLCLRAACLLFSSFHKSNRGPYHPQRSQQRLAHLLTFGLRAVLTSRVRGPGGVSYPRSPGSALLEFSLVRSPDCCRMAWTAAEPIGGPEGGTVTDISRLLWIRNSRIFSGPGCCRFARTAAQPIGGPEEGIVTDISRLLRVLTSRSGLLPYRADGGSTDRRSGGRDRD